MKALRRLYFRLFKHYRRLELKFCSYTEADRLLRDSEGKPEPEQWRLAKEEDDNRTMGWVYLERRERITE